MRACPYSGYEALGIVAPVLADVHANYKDASTRVVLGVGVVGVVWVVGVVGAVWVVG